jgi:alpha-N-acetylglucosamine transferase
MANATQKPKAWVTLLTNPEYVASKYCWTVLNAQNRGADSPATLALYRTMESVSDYPLIIMATDSLPQWARNALTKRGLRIIDVPHLSPAAGQHSGFDPSFVRFNDAWTKLRIFGLTEFERLILIDSDMVFLRGMDELFDYELPGKDWIAAAPACVCNPFQIAHYPEDWYVVHHPYSI